MRAVCLLESRELQVSTAITCPGYKQLPTGLLVASSQLKGQPSSPRRVPKVCANTSRTSWSPWSPRDRMIRRRSLSQPVRVRGRAHRLACWTSGRQTDSLSSCNKARRTFFFKVPRSPGPQVQALQVPRSPVASDMLQRLGCATVFLLPSKIARDLPLACLCC